MDSNPQDTQAQLRAATVGFNYLFANELHKARDTFAAGDSPFHALGYGACAFLEAALGMEVWQPTFSNTRALHSRPIPADRFDGRSLSATRPLRSRRKERTQAVQIFFSDYSVSPRDRMGTAALRCCHSSWPHPRPQVGPYASYSNVDRLTRCHSIASLTWVTYSACMP